jgi:hypothetical protein
MRMLQGSKSSPEGQWYPVSHSSRILQHKNSIKGCCQCRARRVLTSDNFSPCDIRQPQDYRFKYALTKEAQLCRVPPVLHTNRNAADDKGFSLI